MGKNQEDIQLNFKSNMSQVKKEIKEVLDSLKNYEKASNKLNRSASNNAGVASSTATSSYGGSADKLVSAIQDSQKTMQEAMAVFNKVRNSSKVTPSQQEDLQSLIKTLASSTAKATSTAGITGTIGNNTTFSSQTTSLYERQLQERARRQQDNWTLGGGTRELKGTYKSDNSELRHLRTRASNTADALDKSRSVGYITFDRAKDLRSRVGRDKEDTDRGISTIDNRLANLGNQRNTLETEQSKLSKRFSTGDVDENERRTIELKIKANEKEIDAINKTVQNYTDLQEDLKKVKSKLEGSSETFEKSTSSGEIGVGAERGTLRYMLGNRAGAIGMTAAYATAQAARQYADEGQNVRLNSQSNIEGITLADAQQGGSHVGGHADNHLADSLGQLGIDNHTGYGPESMAQFAGSYAQSTGDTRGASKAADALSKLSRFSGIGEDTTNSIMTGLGNTGAASNAKDVNSINQTLAGAISSNHLAAKAGQQGQAFSTLLNNLQGYNLSTGQASSMAAIQNKLASNNPSMQGQAGAQAMSKVASGLSSMATNDPLMMAAFTNGNANYAGPAGRAQMVLDADQMKKDPMKQMQVLKNYAKINPAGMKGAEAMMVQNFGISSDQAKAMGNLANKNYTKKDVEKLVSDNKKKGRKSEKHAEKQYEADGDSTLNIKVAIKANGQMHVSEAGDGARKLTNSVAGKNTGLSGFTSILGSGAMSVGTSVIGSVIGSMITSKGGNLLGSVLGGAEGGGVIKGTANVLKGALSGGKNLLKKSGAKILGKIGALKGGKTILSKGASILDKFGVKGGTKVAEKVGLKTATKLGGKFLGPIGWGLAAVDAVRGAGDIAKDPMNAIKHPFKSIGSLLGISRVNADKKGLFATTTAKADSRGTKGNTTETKVAKLIKDQKKLLKGFNAMLDKAKVVIAEARGINLKGDGSSDSDSGSSDVDSDSTASVSKSAKAWAGDIRKAAKQMGQKITDDEVNKIVNVIQHESGGKAGITGIDDHDGTGSALGLLQFKKSTFAHYAVSGHTNILDGYDQLLAMFNDTNWRSDVHTGGWGPTGSPRKNANGGMYSTPGTTKISEGGQLEAVVPLGAGNEDKAARILDQSEGILGRRLQKNNKSQSGGNNIKVSPVYNISISGGSDNNDKLVEQFKQVIEQSIRDMQTSFSNENLSDQFSMNLNYG